MKRLLCASSFVLAFCAVSLAQNNQSAPCPTIDVTGPSASVKPGDELIFTANVQGIDLKNLTYDWELSVGTIESGQGTPVIKVIFPPEMAGSNITATVEVQGFPAGCANTDSDTPPIPRIADPFPIDDYGKISFSKEKSRLDAIAVELNKDKTVHAYFLIYYTKNDTAVKTRINNIVEYLTKVHKIPKERFTTVTAKGDAYRTRIYLIPKLDSNVRSPIK